MNNRCIFLMILAGSLFIAPILNASDSEPDFESEIAPILIMRCIECHQERSPSGNLVLTTREGFLKGGDSGPAIDLSSPEESYSLERIHDSEMPPAIKGIPQKIPEKEYSLLQRWIKAGAKWPKNRKLDWFEKTTDLRAGRDWWSLQPIQRPPVPKLKLSPQPINAIDAFVLSNLEKENFSPAPAANKRTLIKRLYFDLTGLPPTHSQIIKFVTDKSPQAWEKTIDELLNSPQYGERWGRYWLDLARYADTSGYERDQEKKFSWKYRDWVVNAFNSDMSYQQFVLEQLAGDEIPNRDENSVIATGFLRLGTWNDEPNDPKDYVYERLEDLVHTTSSAFLAMTVKCARCHEHKFDPITQEDYYRMGSTFWAGPIQARGSKLLGGPSEKELGFKDVLGWTDLNSKGKTIHLLKDGERDKPLQEIAPASLSMIPSLEKTFELPSKSSKTTHRRLQFAKWLIDPKHPLTARVMMNRLWLHHFGKGIVRSPNNFGFLADPPTHPELLDWLASEFIEGGWTLKRMHKLILTSKTWQQSSLHPNYVKYELQDAGNRHWWRAERRRLDAETIRDSMLAMTTELDLRMGGPGFKPTISPEALEGLSMKSKAWNASSPKEQARRSLYIYSKRGLQTPMMKTFDLCDSTQTCGQRNITNVPTQALTLMNNSFVHLRSEALAQNILNNNTDQTSQINELWKRIYGREPSSEEITLAKHHLSVQAKRFIKQDEIKTPINESLAERRSELIKNSLVLHLRADQGITADSKGNVSLWKDQSGHEHHAYQTEPKNQPQIDNKIFDGHLALSFNGQGGFMHLKGSLLEDQEYTIIAVVNDKASSGNRAILSNWNGAAGNASTSLFLGLTSEKTVRFSDSYSNAGTIKNRNKPFLMTAINGEHESNVFLNSREIASRNSSLAPRNLSTNWVIAQQGNINGEWWDGGIAEIRVYSIALTDAERRSIEKEISERHAITIESPKALAQALPKMTAPEKAFASLAHVLLNSNEFLYVD